MVSNRISILWRLNMFDAQKAKDSVVKIKEADFSLGTLTRDERENLVAVMEDWWQQQGWNLEELRQGRDKTVIPYRGG